MISILKEDYEQSKILISSDKLIKIDNTFNLTN